MLIAFVSIFGTTFEIILNEVLIEEEENINVDSLALIHVHNALKIPPNAKRIHPFATDRIFML